MMNFSDETLLAFVDGTLDAASCRAIEQAVLLDPAIAQRVAQRVAENKEQRRQHNKEQNKAPRADASGAPVPGAPARQTAPMRSGTVIQLAAVRASKAQASTQSHNHAQAQGAAVSRSAAPWSWPQWSALVATLLVGIFAGRFALPLPYGDSSLLGIAAGNGGALSAQGKLARALTQQDAGAAGNGIEIGLSFVSKEGDYCRSFTLAGAAGAAARAHLVGLACRSGSVWNIAAIIDDPMPVDATASSGGYRMAGAEMPAAIGAAIDQRIAGSVLDALAERDALQRGWRR